MPTVTGVPPSQRSVSFTCTRCGERTIRKHCRHVFWGDPDFAPCRCSAFTFHGIDCIVVERIDDGRMGWRRCCHCGVRWFRGRESTASIDEQRRRFRLGENCYYQVGNGDGRIVAAEVIEVVPPHGFPDERFNGRKSFPFGVESYVIRYRRPGGTVKVWPHLESLEKADAD